MQKLLVVVLVLCVAASCGEEGSEDGTPSSGRSLRQVVYEVSAPSVGSVTAVISYRMPSGEMREETSSLPWQSDNLAFQKGASAMVSARVPDVAKSTSLDCSIVTDREVPESDIRTQESLSRRGSAHQSTRCNERQLFVPKRPSSR